MANLSIGKFVWDACWRQAPVGLKVFETVLGVAPTLAALAAHDASWPPFRLVWWGYILLLLGSLMLAVISGVFFRAYRLERQLLPKVSISDPIYSQMPKDATGHAVRTISVDVQSECSAAITKCSATEQGLVNNLNQESGIIGRFFRLSTERYQQGEHDFTQFFDLRGIGHKVRIDIAEMDETNPNSRVIMTYATPHTSRTLGAIHRVKFPHVLTLCVTADQIARPVEKKFMIDVDSGGFLKMRTIEDGNR